MTRISAAAFDYQSSETLFSAQVAATRRYGRKTPGQWEDQKPGAYSYGDLLKMTLALGRLACKVTTPGEHVGVLMPNMASTVGLMIGLSAFGSRAVHVELHGGKRGHAVRLPGGRRENDPDLARVHDQGGLDRAGGRAARCQSGLSGGLARPLRFARQALADGIRALAAVGGGAENRSGNAGGGAVHLRLGRQAERRGAVAPRLAGQRRTDARHVAHRAAGYACSMRCRFSIPSASPPAR